MRGLEWLRFTALAGDPWVNWELLCREVVRRHYEAFGPLRTRKQQPGVEFHIPLERGGSGLGEGGRHWGWQCKWFDQGALKADGSLRTHQRRDIEDSIAKSIENVDGLTDWVLWTRDKLSAGDARWLEGLEAPFTIHHWDEETLVGLLSGPAEILLETWFGELVLDSETLTRRRREALAPIEQRYEEDLHIHTRVQTGIEDLLFGGHLESELEARKSDLDRISVTLSLSGVEAAENGFGELHGEMGQALLRAEDCLARVIASIQLRELPTAEQLEAPLREGGAIHALEVAVAACKERVNRNGDGYRGILAFEDGLRAARNHLDRLADGLRTPMMVVVGAAGTGKTHLAASLTGSEGRARGVLVLGRQFDAHIEDDDLARHSGLSATREQLLEALEALGMREGRRIPLVIDGINESDNPSAWKVTLARLRTRLLGLRHVFAVVTVRPSYRQLALPAGLPTTELRGFEGHERAAIERYFDYYKIDAPQARLDWWRPSDPLLLSIFCRAANPERKEMVPATQLPGSLAEVFDRYLSNAFDRIEGTMKIPAGEIAAAVLRLAQHCFWATEHRFDPELVADALGDRSPARWNESLRFQLEAEEILVRDVYDGRERVSWSYDLLAGHVLAKGLLQTTEPGELASGRVAEVLESHPLSEDVLIGLAEILGRRDDRDLVELLTAHPALAARAALASVRLPGPLVGEATVAVIEQLFSRQPKVVLDALAPMTLRPGHPLNGRVLDRLLGGLEPWERDLTWTVWGQSRDTETEVTRLAGWWRGPHSSADDEAALAWLSWTLTATKTHLRDCAVQALYRLGKRRPELLFERALQMLDVNDPTVAEGLMAAAYGVAMAAQDPALEAEGAVFDFARQLQEKLLRDPGSQPTFHWLIREYAYRTAQLADWISSGDLNADAAAAQPPLPQPATDVLTCGPGDWEWNQGERSGWGRAARERVRALPVSPRDSGKVESRLEAIEAEVRSRVAQLGWSFARFGAIDGEDVETPPDSDLGLGRAEFGAKYGRIAFYEAIGRLSDRRELGRMAGWRYEAPPLDTSFPESAVLEPIRAPERPRLILGPGDEEVGMVELPRELVRSREMGTDDSPWIAVSGSLWLPPHDRRGVLWTIHGLLAFGGWQAVAELIEEHEEEIRRLPENPIETDCCSGEAPWAPTFDHRATEADGSFSPNVRWLGEMGAESVAVEMVAVDFAWQGESSLNSAEPGPLPGKCIALHAGLRKVADRPEFVDGNGQLAARTVSPRGIGGWFGSVLYLREDLLREYCVARDGEWGWILTLDTDLFKGDVPRTPGSSPDPAHQIAIASLEELHRQDHDS